jgi:ribosomal-protein-alanine N-acetyltransferase
VSVTWPLVLRDRDLVLRPLRRRDRRAYEELRLRNHAWLRPWDATDPDRGRGRPPFAALRRFADGQARAGLAVPLVITVHGRIVGQVTADPVVYGAASHAVLGYWIDEQEQGHGYATRAVALVIDHLFVDMGIHRVEANIRPENSASLALADRLHFRREGLHERSIHVDGAFHDHLCVALTAEEVPPAPGDHTGRGVLERYLREFEASSGES